MEKITPHLWFDKEAREAGRLYTSIFPNSRVKSTVVLTDTPSGTVDVVTIELAGQEFTLLSAGPLFKFTPAISFLVACETKQEVDMLWSKLIEGGSALMDLGEYPFSERYGWLQDGYGLSWQIMLSGGSEIRQKITPVLMYIGDQPGRADAAMKHYTSIFRDSGIGDVMRSDAGVQYGSFTLEGQQFAAMDSPPIHDFGFNEAVSLMVHCGTQQEIDYYWDKLSADPSAEQCGWLKDEFGVSWQVVPAAMDKMLETGDQDQVARVTAAFLKMKKFNLAELEAAYAR